MRFKLPKPLHGWREFAGEVGIIVAGVLIALLAQQLVDDWGWKRKAEAARQDVNTELRGIYVDAKERLAVERCVNSQLDEIAKSVTGAGGTVGPLEIVVSSHTPMIYRTPSREWKQTSWDSAIADGVRSHLDRKERERLDATYSLIAWMRSLEQASDVEGGSLLMLGHRLELNPVVKAQLLGVIETERARTGKMTLLAEQIAQSLDELGFAAPPGKVAERIRGSRTAGTLAWCMKRGLAT